MMLRAWLDPEVFAAFLSPEDLQIMIDKTPAFLKAYRDRSGNIEDVPESIVNQMIENITATGDMSDLDRQIDRLRQFRDAGLTEIGLRAHDDPASTIRTIGERVLPALQ
jgi:glutamine synthetase adenylyltransferase